MSLVVDLALQIAYPKLSAHATVRRDCGTCPAHQGDQGGQVRRPYCPFGTMFLHDSGGNHGSAQAYAALDVPADRRARSVRCIILRSSCRVTLEVDGHLTITTPAYRTAATKPGFVRGAAVCPVPVLVAILLPCVASSALGIAYASCKRAGDVPESMRTTAGLLHARSTCPCVILLPSLTAIP
jgi:hypothetical protein